MRGFEVWTTIAVLGSVTACDRGDAPDTPAGTTVVSTASSTAAASGDGESSSSNTGADESSGGVQGPPQCAKSCLFPGDCCPPGAEGCPSSNYPYAFSCVDDLCVEAGCSADAECGGALSCLPVSGVGTCLQACSADSDCAPISDASVCTGVADGGEGYCFEPCDPTTLSCGNADCDAATGLCTCVNSSQCVVGFTCV